MTRYSIILILFIFAVVSVNGLSNSSRQMVMDDGFTFFKAKPLSKYDSSISLNRDTGWYLESKLRILGTFPKRSAFKILVKKNGRQLSQTRCEGKVYLKSDDSSLRTAMLRRGKDLGYEDNMQTGYRCFNKETPIKPIGKMNVEVYFIDGDSDAEKLVRTYKIDVHKATRVRGSATKPQKDVSHYYISRHAEAGVAILTLKHGKSDYLGKPFDVFGTPSYKKLVVHMSYSPARSGRLPASPYVRCAVDGQRIKLPRDNVSLSEHRSHNERAVYTDRILRKYKRGSAYRDDIEFANLTATLPLYTGEGRYSKPPMKIENHPGKWECKIMANGVTYRTLRWEVGNDGNIVPHAEQKNGNINLFYKTYLVDIEIPKGGTSFDHRLMPMPNAGLFYGIPWTTAEGKAMAAKVPRKGNPYHVPSNRAGK